MEPKSPKSIATREKIVTSALELFRTDGYDKTTMRAIAERSGLSLGSTYYYFRSKDQLMQGFYEQLFSSFSGQVQPVLGQETAFQPRLTRSLEIWVENARPFHGFAAGFFRFAADPSSPLSPFSAESAPTRQAMVELFKQVVEGSRLKVPSSISAQLPEMLWLYQMGIVLFWVFDDSPEQAKTFQLIHRTVPLVSRLIGLARLPGAKSLASEVAKLFSDLRTAG
jgi:AcrR family transcriptional regulator